MATKMFSPKIEIINYFDELINQVDIDIDESIKNYNENQVLGELECFKIEKRETQRNHFLSLSSSIDIIIKKDDDDEYQTVNTVDLWSESTKVIDYLNQVRMRTIDELIKAQEESLESYKLNSSRFSYLKEIKDDDKIEELKSQLFGERFYFQVRLNSEDYKPWIFNVFTFVTDFYMSPSDIDTLEMLISNSSDLDDFDEKMLLISLLYIHFYGNFIHPYPNNVISLRKRDTRNIKEINISEFVTVIKLTSSSIDLSKLERLIITNENVLVDIELDGFCSLQYLKLNIDSVERFSVRDLPSLKHLVIESEFFNKSLSTLIFGNLPNIKELEINGRLYNIDLNDLVDLDKLSISGRICYFGFNFGLFNNICYHLKELSFGITGIEDKSFIKLFYGHLFQYLKKLRIMHSEIKKLEREMFEGFPMLQSLSINDSYELRKIDFDSFSSLTNLVYLDLSSNFIEVINQTHFSALTNLENLKLSHNKIQSIEENSFTNFENLTELDLSFNQLSILKHKLFAGLRNLKNLDLRCNKLTCFEQSVLDDITNIEKINLTGNLIINKDEIMRRFKDSKVHFDF